MAVFKFAQSYIPGHERSSLSKFQQFFAVLMKLRLSLSDQDIAYRFGVSQSCNHRQEEVDQQYVHQFETGMPRTWTATENNATWLQTELQQIDCFEVFCERPSNLMARAQTYSNYKQHNTVKFLIGIAPQGFISFVSKGWGGRVSDKHLTGNCGILDHLLPEDLIVLADSMRGNQLVSIVQNY